MKRSYSLYINDILEAMNSINNFIDEMEYKDFEKDDKTISAVIRKFEIIGEATKHIPNKLRNQYPLIPWKEMAGMRDKLIHFYFGADCNLIWKTIKNRIPKIKSLIEKILRDIENQD